MKNPKHPGVLAASFLLLGLSLNAQSDTTPDRWSDSGNNTVITPPGTGQVLIQSTTLNTVAEQVLRSTVNDDTSSYFSLLNGTLENGFYQPVLRGHYGSNYKGVGGGAGLYLYSSIDSRWDTQTSPTVMMSFEVRRSTNKVFTATDNAVQNVDLFRWRNLGTVLMLMDSNGQLGVNTSAPTARFHVDGSVRLENLPAGTGTNYLVSDNNGNVYEEPLSSLAMEDYDWYLSSGGNQTTSFPANNSDDIFTLGRVGIGGAASLSETPAGTTNPMPITLTVYGNSYASGGQWTSSDQRYKENMSSVAERADAVLKNLNGYSYTFKTTNTLKLPAGTQFGLMAQEVQKVIPEAVAEITLEGQDILAVNYQMITPFLVEGYKKQRDLIEEQRTQITRLSKEIEDIKTLLQQNNQSLSTTNAASTRTTVSIYPNPTNGLVNIELNLPQHGKEAFVQVFDLSGHLVKVVPVEAYSTSVAVDIEDLAKGTYTFVVSSNSGILGMSKVVLE